MSIFWLSSNPQRPGYNDFQGLRGAARGNTKAASFTNFKKAFLQNELIVVGQGLGTKNPGSDRPVMFNPNILVNRAVWGPA